MNYGHPRRSDLALYSGGDLGVWDRLRVRAHVRGCGRCGDIVEAFRSDREDVRDQAAALPSGLDWDRLASEMTANIRVGLAAGQCVDDRKTSRPVFGIGFRPAAAFASVTALVVGGWWLSLPGPGGATNVELLRHAFEGSTPGPAPYDNVVTLGSTQEGLELKQNGAVLRIAHPGASPTLVTASTAGSVRARYIDDDTGQVTITNVYSQ